MAARNVYRLTVFINVDFSQKQFDVYSFEILNKALATIIIRNDNNYGAKEWEIK